jgi:hypothetical protein
MREIEGLSRGRRGIGSLGRRRFYDPRRRSAWWKYLDPQSGSHPWAGVWTVPETLRPGMLPGDTKILRKETAALWTA